MKKPTVKPSHDEIDQLLKQAEEALWTQHSVAETLVSEGIRLARAVKHEYAEWSFRLLEAEAMSDISYTTAKEAYQTALHQTHALGYGGLEARAMVGLAFIEFHQSGDFPTILGILERALVIAKEHADLTAQGCAYEGLCSTRYMAGDVIGAAEAGRASFSAFEAAGNISAARNALTNLASILYSTGRLDDALQLAARVMEKPEAESPAAAEWTPPSPYVEMEVLKVTGLVNLRLGKLEEALENFRQSYSTTIAAGFELRTDVPRRYIAYTLTELGRYAEALNELEPALHSPRRNEVMQAHIHRAIALIGMERYDEAERALLDFRNVFFPEAPQMVLLDYYKIKSRLHRARKEFEDALLAKEESERISTSLVSAPSIQSSVTQTYLLLQMERDRHARELEQLRVAQMERDLSNTTLQLISQTELLSDLREDLLRMARKISVSEPVGKELRDRIKNLPCKSVDWTKFDTQFKAAHPEFTKRLIELYPELSSQELRICSLLRMNLKSEEMARLLCLSERTIESHRLRIRRKMKLTSREHDLMLHLARM